MERMRKNVKKVIVIGGGAAGMMAAVTAAQRGCQVVLYEKNEKLYPSKAIRFCLKNIIFISVINKPKVARVVFIDFNLKNAESM